MRRIRGALGMGLTWAAGWALAVPGFFGGALFSIVLGIAGRRRRFDQLSLPRFTALGAIGGLMLSLLPAAMVGVGLASLGSESGHGLWELTAMISGPLILLSALSASASLILARKAQRQNVLDSADTAAAALDGSDMQTLIREPEARFPKLPANNQLRH